MPRLCITIHSVSLITVELLPAGRRFRVWSIGAEVVNDQEHLERFVVDNPELEQLEDLLAKFNIFEVLKLQRQEIRHSNFLAWLLIFRLTRGVRV